jgi:hypothetical protein
MGRRPQLKRLIDPLPLEPPRFVVGDRVHAMDGGEVGVVEFIRRDGMCCLRWPSGTREWRPQQHLCGPLTL